MLKAFVLIICAVAASAQLDDPSTHQLLRFKNKTKGPIGLLTTNTGAPVEYRATKSSLNTDLLSNDYLIQGITHGVRETIPERIVHTQGTGAFGYFEVTHDISHICKAKLFSKVGKKTPVAVRLSQTFSKKGAVDLGREVRGFGVKFYTEDGNLDLVGFNTEVYTFKEPLLFQNVIHANKLNPATNFVDLTALWDFAVHNPESIFTLLQTLISQGIPDGYEHMSGHTMHTFEVLNEKCNKSFVRFHWFPTAGRKNLNNTEATRLGAIDPSYLARKLYNNIENRNYPSWTLGVQILSQHDVDNADFDVFDVTKTLPFHKYPLNPVGKIYLNKNPTNHFAQVEQLALCPANLVPGILGCPDALFKARRFAYKEAHNHRLGANANNIPVNCPIHGQAHTYYRDGVPPVGDNGKDSPSYYPNSFNGLEPYHDKCQLSLSQIHEEEADNIKEIRDYYNELSSQERSNVVENIILSITPVEDFLKCQIFDLLKNIHVNLGARVAKAFTIKCKK